MDVLLQRVQYGCEIVVKIHSSSAGSDYFCHLQGYQTATQYGRLNTVQAIGIIFLKTLINLTMHVDFWSFFVHKLP